MCSTAFRDRNAGASANRSKPTGDVADRGGRGGRGRGDRGPRRGGDRHSRHVGGYDLLIQISFQSTNLVIVTPRSKPTTDGVLLKAMPSSMMNKLVKPSLRPTRRMPQVKPLQLMLSQRKRSLSTTASLTRNTKSNWRRRDRHLLLKLQKSASLTRVSSLTRSGPTLKP